VWLLALAPALGGLLLHPAAIGKLLARFASRAGMAAGRPPSAPALAALAIAYAGLVAPAGLALGALAGMPPIAGIGVFAGAWMIGFSSLITPSGLGVREAAIVALAAALGDPAAQPTVAAAALAHRAALLVGEFGVAGAFWAASLHLVRRR
jgi:hypothetical protein